MYFNVEVGNGMLLIAAARLVGIHRNGNVSSLWTSRL